MPAVWIGGQLRLINHGNIVFRGEIQAISIVAAIRLSSFTYPDWSQWGMVLGTPQPCAFFIYLGAKGAAD